MNAIWVVVTADTLSPDITMPPQYSGWIMMTILGALAEFERELNRAHTGEGLKRTRKRGVRSELKPKLTHHFVARRIFFSSYREHDLSC